MSPPSFKDIDYSFLLPEQICQRFTLAEIQSATYNFDEALVIGRGGFGKICVGAARGLDYLHTGKVHEMPDVAVASKPMMLDCAVANKPVKLDGPGRTSLSWVARLKIAVGAAQGLSFLHQRKHPAYREFKSNFILVDTDFNARLSNYEVEDSFINSTSHLFQMDVPNTTAEWSGYHADKLDGLIKLPTEDGVGLKREIYDFGVVLLEILTGKVHDVRRPLGKQKLVKWATPLLEEVNIGMVMDPQLQHNYSLNGAFTLAQLVLNCIQPSEAKRPSMEEILQVLYQCYQDQMNDLTLIV
ncbi:hypothetical protein L1887_38796 [Cichorium endivia]|nr:hypothetical protein L1887_38796 [Cichorium endivia]